MQLQLLTRVVNTFTWHQKCHIISTINQELWYISVMQVMSSKDLFHLSMNLKQVVGFQQRKNLNVILKVVFEMYQLLNICMLELNISIIQKK